ncbi:VOC family protein [Rheinheimera texasensis]|uniref:VOC family protein n=1 Tax=Rheinheimera texasensis TaxID=306205 RepID=UPI0032B1DB77
MSKMIFVNLPVTDLTASVGFYQALGFTQNMQFSDDTAACMVWSDSILVMLLTHAKWQTFTTRPIPASNSSEVMLALNADSKDAVDQFVAIAGAQGGTADVNPLQDLGFMYSRSALDLDGHLWEVFWMDPAALGSDQQ